MAGTSKRNTTQTRSRSSSSGESPSSSTSSSTPSKGRLVKVGDDYGHVVNVRTIEDAGDGKSAKLVDVAMTGGGVRAVDPDDVETV